MNTIQTKTRYGENDFWKNLKLLVTLFEYPKAYLISWVQENGEVCYTQILKLLELIRLCNLP